MRKKEKVILGVVAGTDIAVMEMRLFAVRLCHVVRLCPVVHLCHVVRLYAVVHHLCPVVRLCLALARRRPQEPCLVGHICQEVEVHHR